WKDAVVSRVECDFARHALSPHEQRARGNREECTSGRIPREAVSHAKTGGVQKRGRPRNSRPTVPTKDPEATRPRSHLHARRTNPADAARLSLHAVLPQRLCDESISREQRLHRAFS